MNGILQSRAMAWLALLAVIIAIIFTFSFRPAWWAFFDEFFAFMMVFTHLIAVYFAGRFKRESRMLDLIAFWCGVLAVLSFIVEYIIWQVAVK